VGRLHRRRGRARGPGAGGRPGSPGRCRLSGSRTPAP
jgi:hypothetical protein